MTENVNATGRIRKSSLWKRIVKYRWMYLFLLPAVIWYIIFAYGPIYGLQIGFKDFKILKGIEGSPWVGFKHFGKMMTDKNFIRVMWNTIFISGLKLIFVAPSGLVLALLLNEVRNSRFKVLSSSVSMLPHFFSWVIIASLLQQILSPANGMINGIIKFFGGTPIYFLGDSRWFIVWVVLSDMWESAGWNSIIFVAAIAAISPDLYEAAQIDGASRWKQLTNVTLPCIAGTIVVVLVLRVGSIMSGGFNQIFNMYNDAVMQDVDIIDTYVYRLGITNQKYSYSTAVELFKNVVSLSLVLMTNALSKRVTERGLF